jgi:curved DNA-binding protein CbpA
LSEFALDPYEVLEVHPRASQDVIAAAHRALARRYHPDLSQDPADARRMVAINRAWELLQNSERRARHDRERAQARSGSAAYASPAAFASPAAYASPAASTSSGPTTAADVPASGAHRPGGDATYRAAARAPDGSVGPPRGLPFGSRLEFGQYRGWTLGQIRRADPGYLFWLERQREGQPYLAEIDRLLKSAGLRLRPDGQRVA